MNKVNSKLREINLGANEIGNEGALSIADGLVKNSHITKLLLADNVIEDSGSASLKQVTKAKLLNSEIFEVLDLRRNAKPSAVKPATTSRFILFMCQ